MADFSSPIYQVNQIRELEMLAQQRFGVSGDMMMQRAGKAAFQLLRKRWPIAKRIAVLCSVGNNGGDGYVLAELAHRHGLVVNVWQVGQTQHLKAEALRAYEACKKAGVAITPFQGRDDLILADVLIDALHGIGLQGVVRQESRAAIEAMNASKKPILALDIPSGIDANTGYVLGVAVKAQATITFIATKLGLLTGSGMAYAGEVICDDLELPAELFSLVKPAVEKLSFSAYKQYFVPRQRDWHKGSAGHVLVIGGDVGYVGAPRMAAEAALRVGAGLVTVVTHPKHSATLNVGRPEIICHGVRFPFFLRALLKKVTVVVIGPGLGKSWWAKRLLSAVLKTNLPLVVDADALNLIAANSHRRSHWVLTPHPGEAARLLKQTPAQIQQDRFKALQQLQIAYQGVIALKGAGTLVLAPDTLPAVCDVGNPGMATAGMGDVLSGVIGGLIAQGVPLVDAAKAGVCLHACAGDSAAAAGGERGMLAMDLMPFLRQWVN